MVDPYAPPKSEVEGTVEVAPDLKRRPLWLVVLLAVVTLGYYPFVWLYVTSRAINAFFPGRRVISPLWAALAVVVVVADLVLFFAMFVIPISQDLDELERLVTLTFGIIGLLWAFRVREGVAAIVSRTGIGPYPLSGLATFFLTIYYLQYKINRLPEKPLHDDLRDSDPG